MTLTYPELWLLETNVQRQGNWLPFPFLPDGKEEKETGRSSFWQSPAHGMSLTKLGEALWSLGRRGDIQFRLAELRSDGTPFQPTSPSELSGLIQADFDRFEESGRWKSCDAYHWYAITPQGFARWETFAQPDWSRFLGEFDERILAEGKAQWTQTALTEAFAHALLDFRAVHFRMQDQILWETKSVEQFSPWRPLPLKELPAGVRLTVQVELAPMQRTIANRKESLEYAHWCTERARLTSELEQWFPYGIANHPQRPRPIK